MKNLPQQAFLTVNRDEPADEDQFLETWDSTDYAADGKEWKEVGVYQLVKIVRVREIVETRTETETVAGSVA